MMLVWLARLALWGYGLAFQAALAILHFVVSVPYLGLMLLPIPVLAPYPLYAGRFPRLWRVYLCLQLLGITVQMTGRVLLDLWVPVRI